MQFIIFLHVFSAVGLGYFLLFPFLTSRLASASDIRAGLAAGLAFFNRIGQYVLIVAFLTGGYLVSKYNLSVPWMVSSVVLVLVMFAMTGMMGKPLKAIAGGDNNAPVKKIQLFGAINAIALLLIIILMVNRNLL